MYEVRSYSRVELLVLGFLFYYVVIKFIDAPSLHTNATTPEEVDNVVTNFLKLQYDTTKYNQYQMILTIKIR